MNPLVGRPEKTRIPPSFANPTKPRWGIINNNNLSILITLAMLNIWRRWAGLKGWVNVGLCDLDPFCWCILSWQPPLPWCSGISASLNMGLDHLHQLGIVWSRFWRVHQPSVARAEPWMIFLVIQNHPQFNRYTKYGTIVRCWCFSGYFVFIKMLLVHMWWSTEANTYCMCDHRTLSRVSTWLLGARKALLERGKYSFLPHKAGPGPRAPLEDSLSFDNKIIC